MAARRRFTLLIGREQGYLIPVPRSGLVSYGLFELSSWVLCRLQFMATLFPGAYSVNIVERSEARLVLEDHSFRLSAAMVLMAAVVAVGLWFEA